MQLGGAAGSRQEDLGVLEEVLVPLEVDLEPESAGEVADRPSGASFGVFDVARDVIPRWGVITPLRMCGRGRPHDGRQRETMQRRSRITDPTNWSPLLLSPVLASTACSPDAAGFRGEGHET